MNVKREPRSKNMNLVIARKQVGHTQETLAEAAKCRPKTISRAERGERAPGPDIQRRIAKALDEEVSHLFGQSSKTQTIRLKRLTSFMELNRDLATAQEVTADHDIANPIGPTTPEGSPVPRGELMARFLLDCEERCGRGAHLTSQSAGVVAARLRQGVEIQKQLDALNNEGIHVYTADYIAVRRWGDAGGQTGYDRPRMVDVSGIFIFLSEKKPRDYILRPTPIDDEPWPVYFDGDGRMISHSDSDSDIPF